MESYKNIEALRLLGYRETPFGLSQEDLRRVEDSYNNLMKGIEQKGGAVYGIHTGFGFNVKNIITKSWEEHNQDLLAYLSVGVGEPLPDRVVRRALRLQALKISRGISGIHPSTLGRLVEASAAAQLASVPRHGSLGASGDLIPMAHAVAPLFKDHPPAGPRDVLGLVNTNAIMSSYAVDQWVRTNRIFTLATEIVGLVSLALGAADSFFLSPAFSYNNLQDSVAGAGESISAFRTRLLQETGQSFLEVEGAPIQERYSVRCSPQVLGNLADIQQFAAEKILKEALSVADNPVILRDSQGRLLIQHGGLFYAAGIATAADLLADISGRVSEMLDRQILLLMDPELSHGLPFNLESPPDLHVKGIHQLISALAQSIRIYSIPSRALSFSCESNNQDIVPCGMAALNALDEMLEKAEEVIRASYFVALRAFALRYLDRIPQPLLLKNWTDFPRDLSPQGDQLFATAILH